MSGRWRLRPGPGTVHDSGNDGRSYGGNGESGPEPGPEPGPGQEGQAAPVGAEPALPVTEPGAGGPEPAGHRREPVWKPEWEPSRARASPGRRPTAWKAVFFGLASVAIVAGVAWALLGSRFLVVRSVRVIGAGPLVPRARVMAAAGIPLGLPLIRVNSAAVAHRVEGIRQVLSAEVSRDWPDTLVISVRLRTPVFAVRGPGGYALIDPFGVDVRPSATRPARLPLLTVGTGAVSPGSLRGSAAVRAAAAVLRELPPRIGRQVRAVTAAGATDVSVRLADGVEIVWGGTGRAREKARELAVLMHTHARLYDVSAPATAVTQG